MHDEPAAAIVVDVADMKVSNQAGDIIMTHALGSCIGVSVYDPVACIGGLVHIMLPASSVSPDKAKNNPFMFVDSGIPIFLNSLCKLGADKKRFVVKVAGGAQISQGEDFFAIGKRNYLMLRKLFWMNGIIIAGQDVGGNILRTMYLDINTGRTWLVNSERNWDI